MTSSLNAPIHAILEVKWGKSAYKRQAMAPGESVLVGHAQEATLAIAHDHALSQKQFQVTWDGESCHLRVISEEPETLLNGEPVLDGDLMHGDWVRAGETNFCLYIENSSPPSEPDPPPSDEQLEGRQSARKQLMALKTPLYAVLDAARDERILTVLQESVGRYHCLYEGAKGEAMAEAAPYLAKVSVGSRRFEMLLEEGFGNAWGIWLTSLASFEDIRRHLRRFLMIKLEGESEKVYFRYYDPRVFRMFLSTCEEDQLVSFFSEDMIETFLYEDETFNLRNRPKPVPAQSVPPKRTRTPFRRRH